jgi:transcriptional regulator with GAF, ATPase, and Fis domain
LASSVFTTPSGRAFGSTKRSRFLESIARHLVIGYQYTNLYVVQERESRRTNALLEIANTLNSHSDFNEVSARVIERAITLVGADYGALGVLDEAGKKISLASFKSAEGIKPSRVLKMVESHGKSLNVDTFAAVGELIRDGKTMSVNDSQLPLPIRLLFNTQLGGKAALLSPVRVGGSTFGLLGFVWSKETSFDKHDIDLVEGIADQIGTALERDQLSAEVMRLKSELHQRRSEIIGQAPAIHRAIEMALNVAGTNTTVLVQGESGTGKELLANLIHFNSGPRAETVRQDQLRRDPGNAARIRAFRPREGVVHRRSFAAYRPIRRS